MKGIIADIKGRQAVLLTENNEYYTIKNKGYAIGQRVTHTPASYTKFTALAAAVVLCILTSLSGMKIYYSPVNYIDIDINPSMRIGINTFDRVVEFTPLNDDAQRLLDTIGTPKGSVDKCIKALVEVSEDLGYINDNNQEVTVEVISDDKAFYDRTEQYCKDITENNAGVRINVHQSDKDNLVRAEELGVSVGKLRLLDEYKNISGENADNSNIKDKSNAELAQMIEDVRSTKAPSKSENTPNNNPAPDAVPEKSEKAAKETAKQAEKAAEKAEKETEKQAEKTEKAAEKANEEAKKQAEEAAKAAEKSREEAEKQAEKQAKEAEKAAEKAKEEAAKEAEKAAEKQNKEAQKTAEKQAKETEKQDKEK